jgi:hypothetical protein
LAISEIVADTLDNMDLKLPPIQVNIQGIPRKYHAAAAQEERRNKSPKVPNEKRARLKPLNR